MRKIQEVHHSGRWPKTQGARVLFEMAPPPAKPAKRKRCRRTPQGCLTPTQVSKRVGVDVETVYSWINDKQLPAVNMSRSRTAKVPRWIVKESDLETFLTTRATQPAAKPRRRRRGSGEDSIQFYT